MAKVAFINRAFTPASAALIERAELVMLAYARQGYKLTLRQLYYQMIAQDLFPESWVDPVAGTKNNLKNYKRFGDLVSNARMAGLLDWDIIEDRARETVTPPSWQSPAEIAMAAAEQFRFNKWEDQPNHVEVMVEKDAVSGILAPVCRQLQVRFTANRGYASSSLFYEVGQRLASAMRAGKEVFILYLGDHDPSGIDMTRDLTERLELFTQDAREETGAEVNVERLALNMDQVRQWNPPENPAKDTDSRFETYRRNFGDSSWELDALEPAQLAQLVRVNVIGLRDEDLWEAAVEREDEARASLRRLAAKL